MPSLFLLASQQPATKCAGEKFHWRSGTVSSIVKEAGTSASNSEWEVKHTLCVSVCITYKLMYCTSAYLCMHIPWTTDNSSWNSILIDTDPLAFAKTVCLSNCSCNFCPENLGSDSPSTSWKNPYWLVLLAIPKHSVLWRKCNKFFQVIIQCKVSLILSVSCRHMCSHIII